ncbi:MAG: homocysteine S-methyltransferase family protein, partial [Acidimicrobiia bacterium]
MSGYLDAVGRGLVIFDGATGTSLQRAGLTAGDFGGPDLEGCNEILNQTRPDVVADLHRSFLDVGVDVVETNSFGGFAVPLGEYGLADRAYELAAAAAGIARGVVDEYLAADGRERWVAGSMGPGNKFPTLGQITYRELAEAYQVEAAGLIDGGADLLIIETMFDLLAAKAAMNGARAAMRHAGRELPLQVQVTIELSGRMIAGTEIGAALTTLDALRPDVVGLNCATGPKEMHEPLRHLTEHARMPVSAIPNAGLPKVVDGEMVYDLGGEEFSEHLSRFVTELGVGVIGGCCGTTPEHMATIVERCRPLTPRPRRPVHVPAAASIYSQVPFHQDTSILSIGERTNANGSKAFREAMLAGDHDACVAIGRRQVSESAHLVDLCVDYV